MKENLLRRVIHYLEGMLVYTDLITSYFREDEMDDFDKAYVAFFDGFKQYVLDQCDDPTSPLNVLRGQYKEMEVDYPDSLLFGCLDALKEGYQRQYYYQQGKKDVYLRFLQEVYNFDGSKLLEECNEEQFKIFESNVFVDLDVDALKKPSKKDG